MFIRNGTRINIYAPFEINGIKYHNLANPELRSQFGVTEIADPTPPEDYSEELYYKTEQDAAPYIVYTRKSDEQITTYFSNKIKQYRDNLIENGGCTVAGKKFHSDTKSKQQQLALVLLGANIPANLQWKTMDGTFVTMTSTLAQQLFAAQVTREVAIFAKAEEKIAALPANLNINEGWPE